MIENVTSLLVNSSATYIPIKLVSEVSPYQFWLSIIISAASLILFIFLMSKGIFSNLALKSKLQQFSKLTGRPTVMIKHTNSGLFSMNMITLNLVPKLNKILQKMKGRRFNLILETPGGDVMATILISKILRKYMNQIDVYVPNYSMSGGSLLTLTGDTFHFNDYSCIGACDPQIGGLFNSGSAAAWKDVMRIKKNKVDDKSIIYHKLGQQVTKSISTYIYGLIKNKCTKPKQFTKFITDGNIEHIFQIDSDLMRTYGFKVIDINDVEKEILDNIMRIKTQEEVFSSI